MCDKRPHTFPTTEAFRHLFWSVIHRLNSELSFAKIPDHKNKLFCLNQSFPFASLSATLRGILLFFHQVITPSPDTNRPWSPTSKIRPRAYYGRAVNQSKPVSAFSQSLVNTTNYACFAPSSTSFCACNVCTCRILLPVLALYLSVSVVDSSRNIKFIRNLSSNYRTGHTRPAQLLSILKSAVSCSTWPTYLSQLYWLEIVSRIQSTFFFFFTTLQKSIDPTRTDLDSFFCGHEKEQSAKINRRD